MLQNYGYCLTYFLSVMSRWLTAFYRLKSKIKIPDRKNQTIYLFYSSSELHKKFRLRLVFKRQELRKIQTQFPFQSTSKFEKVG